MAPIQMRPVRSTNRLSAETEASLSGFGRGTFVRPSASARHNPCLHEAMNTPPVGDAATAKRANANRFVTARKLWNVRSLKRVRPPRPVPTHTFCSRSSNTQENGVDPASPFDGDQCRTWSLELTCHSPAPLVQIQTLPRLSSRRSRTSPSNPGSGVRRVSVSPR